MNTRVKTTGKVIGLTAVVLAFFVACEVSVFFPGWLDDDVDVSIELTWSGDEDLDLYVTVPVPSDGEMNSTLVYDSVTKAYDGSILGSDLGFFPEDGTANRERIHDGNRSSSVNGNVVFNTSASNDNREVIEIDGIPFVYATNFNTPNGTSLNGLPSGYEYSWLGIMEVYVWAPSGQVSDADDVEITVYQGDNSAGTFRIPTDTTVEGASLVRIPIFRARASSLSPEFDAYQILAHTQLLTSSSQIRSVSEPTVIGDYHVLTVFGSEDE